MIVQDLKNETDLKPGEPKILEFLAEHEPCEQKAIAHGCDLDSASVTGILRRMEDRGLIHREMKDGNLSLCLHDPTWQIPSFTCGTDVPKDR